MPLSAWYRCIRGCSGRHSVFDVIYRCPTCGGLLEVAHDTAALAERSGPEWRALFEQGLGTRDQGSGVWAKREWVLPQIRPENTITLGEGYTPLIHSPRLGRDLGVEDLWVKQCGVSHTGSFKDLGMTVLVSAVAQIIADGTGGVPPPVRAVACASTGDTSAALAAYAAAAGIPAIVFLPRGKITTAQLIQPISHGARVLALDTDFDGCMKIVKEVTQDNTIYLANSMNSLRVEGQKTVGVEIIQQLGWQVPDWIVLPSGNLGNVSALAKGLALAHELGVIDRVPRLVAAQAEAANPLYRAYLKGFERLEPVTAGPTAASAIRIGDPVSYEKAVVALRDFNGIVEQASEDELADAAALADRAGLYACPHTGVALAVAAKLARRGIIQGGQRVVVISTAHGLKFSEFKIGYHEGALADVIARRRNPPVELPADAGAVKAELDKWLRGVPARDD
ncbi:MAG: threonine synthase [Chloroflexi bacterium]|nr:threonine synthase [Chloroflexota bacterium]